MSPITKKLREAFAGRSTTGRDDYFSCKGNGVNAFDATLQDFELSFDRNELTDFHGDEGRAKLTIVDEFSKPVGCALLSWYRMPSGRYEFTGYIC